MPRFNAAKSWKKLDDDLSGKFNYLCDLLDEGYSSVALINNHEIAIGRRIFTAHLLRTGHRHEWIAPAGVIGEP